MQRAQRRLREHMLHSIALQAAISFASTVEPAQRRMATLDTSKIHGAESQAICAAASTVEQRKRTETMWGKYFSFDALLV